MTREECEKYSKEYRIVCHLGGKFAVNPLGSVYVAKVIKENGQLSFGPFEKRQVYCNADGYSCVSAPVIQQNKKSWRSVAVHILVAKAWVKNPDNKPEANHLDFDRTNFCAYNLEWVTHEENVTYSHKAGRYTGSIGKDNPNYGNDTLHLKYLSDPKLAKEKQSRPGGKNGRAKPCNLFHKDEGLIGTFEYQRDAVNCLIGRGVIKEGANKESAIYYLRREQGYKGYFLRLI